MSRESAAGTLYGVNAPITAPTGRVLSRLPLLVVLAGSLLVIGGVLSVPADATLKGTTRLVFFHGAVVWTALINAGAATALGVALFVSGLFAQRGGDRAAGALPRGGTGPLWRFFSFATLFWVLTLVLSFPVMQASWGGVLWGESRLVMSFQVVFLYLAAWGLCFIFLLDRPRRWLAAAASLTGLLTSYLVTSTPGSFHPDNPIFRSGDPRFIGSFLVILVGLVCVTGGATFMRRLPLSDGFVGQPRVDAGV